MAWHIANDCPICDKRLTDEHDDAILVHDTCIDHLKAGYSKYGTIGNP
jgi:hypothetical protein